MGYTGVFLATELDEQWDGYEDLAELCAEAVLSRRQARVVLLYCRGLTYDEIAVALKCARSEVWRSRRRAIQRISDAFPHARQILAELRAGDHDANRDIWDTFREITRGHGGDGWVRIIRARVISPEDLGIAHWSILDVIPWLLRERRNGQSATGGTVSKSSS